MQDAIVVTSMQREVQGMEAGAPRSIKFKFLSLMVWLASMETISDVSSGPIFGLDFWTNLLESKAYTSFHFHWQLQTEANFWNTGRRLKFHFHFSEIIQMSSVDTEPSQQSELFSILLWRGSWFLLFTHFGAIKSPRLRLGLFIAPKCVKSQNQLPFHTMKRSDWIVNSIELQSNGKDSQTNSVT